MEYPNYIVRDLGTAGLVPEDVNARLLENAERGVTGTPLSIPGYVLPFFDIRGRILPFYRVRLLEGDTRFRQPHDTPTHLYYPKGFWQTLEDNGYVLVTVGEKQARCAVKAGFPCVGLTGPSDWKNRVITVSGDSALSQASPTKLAIRLHGSQGDGGVQETYDSPVANGFLEFIDLCVERKLHVVIVFETDNLTGKCKTDNQRAAALLGYELRFRGIPFNRVRQLVLPKMINYQFDGDNLSLSDYIVAKGAQSFRDILLDTLAKKSAFPKHPNVRDYINRRLQHAKMSRKEMQEVSMAILSDLDSHGIRLRNQAGETFYFDHVTKKLLKSAWVNGRDDQFDAPFTQYLYREYGLSANDFKVLVWLGTQFASEDPIDAVSPYRIYARPEVFDDSVIFQISDAEYCSLDQKGLRIHQNGDNNILFEADQVEPLDSAKLVTEYNRLASTPVENWWSRTLGDVRLRDKDKQRVMASLLYYMSPWLFRWRGMQLPVELVIGESGSGKSTLLELRLDILTGRPLLRNTPTDLKDWHASVSNTGGLHVTDNVQLVDRTMRQRLSDELCRITTEPEPFIEQRKYYTNADIVRIPVRTVFALTAIQQPFQNADILQRAIILELDKSIEEQSQGQIRYDSNWKANQLSRFGGRESWIAHHMLVLQKFFQLVASEWNDGYQAKHRLINFEQSIILMAKVFGVNSTWIPDFLVNATDRAVSEADWILEGLHAFALEHNHPNLQGKRFKASVIAEWCEEQIEFKDCDMLTNVRKLGKYLRAHKSAIYHLTGITEAGTEGNRMSYRFKGRTLERR